MIGLEFFFFVEFADKSNTNNMCYLGVTLTKAVEPTPRSGTHRGSW